MTLEGYKAIVEERLKAIDGARRSIERANALCSSTFLWSALEQVRLARLEVESDLRHREKLDRDAQLRIGADDAGRFVARKGT